MKTKAAFVILIVFLAGLLGLPAWPEQASTEMFRWMLYLDALYLSGYMAIALMAMSMVLAMRWPAISRRLGGLDRAYQWHKLLALWGVGLGLFHYLLRLIVKALRRAELMIKPHDAPSGTLDLLRPFSGSAKDLAEYALYLAIALVLLALWRRLPYRWFALTHKLIPLAFLAVVYHSVVFLPRGCWQGMGWLAAGLLMALMLVGSIAALISLFGRVGQGRRHEAELIEVKQHPLQVLELRLKLAPGWPGHESGQFALLTLDSREGAHPFTIVSSWKNDGELVFAIKALGDYTRRLPELVSAGDRAWVEGPYGRFVFADARSRQIWVGAGIGMTPFVARMQELAQERAKAESEPSPSPAVDLFYCTRKGDDDVTQGLRDLAASAGVTIHVIEAASQGQLTTQLLMDTVPQWRDASVWFCGPEAFGQALSRDLIAAGLAASDFHREAFNFR